MLSEALIRLADKFNQSTSISEPFLVVTRKLLPVQPGTYRAHKPRKS